MQHYARSNRFRKARDSLRSNDIDKMPLAIVQDQATVVAHRDGGFSFIEMRTKIKQQGFTLLEIMLVVSIIVIILGVAISKLGNTTAIAKTMRVQADVQAIKTQLQLYESMNGFFPTHGARFAGAGDPTAKRSQTDSVVSVVQGTTQGSLGQRLHLS